MRTSKHTQIQAATGKASSPFPLLLFFYSNPCVALLHLLSFPPLGAFARAVARSLALLDAGVPLTAPVAGVSVGLVSRNRLAAGAQAANGGHGLDYVLLSDILGLEDHYGDMDFKVPSCCHACDYTWLRVRAQYLSRISATPRGGARVFTWMVCVPARASSASRWPGPGAGSRRCS